MKQFVKYQGGLNMEGVCVYIYLFKTWLISPPPSPNHKTTPYSLFAWDPADVDNRHSRILDLLFSGTPMYLTELFRDVFNRVFLPNSNNSFGVNLLICLDFSAAWILVLSTEDFCFWRRWMLTESSIWYINLWKYCSNTSRIVWVRLCSN